VELVYPERLRPGDLIAVVSPASPPYGAKREGYRRGIQYLRDLGYRVIEGEHVSSENGYLAGTDEQRLADLNAMLQNPQVRAILCTRGGYGSIRILDKVDFEAAKNSPKILVGYSDITALQLALLSQSGLVTLSGPMVAVELGAIDPVTEKYFWPLLTGTRSLALDGKSGGARLRLYRGGLAEGPLIPGCLSVISALVGTPYLPDMNGAILVLEDVGEPVYRIDRNLNHLRHAGILSGLNGLIFGQFLDPQPGVDAGIDPDRALDELFQQVADRLDCPVLGRFPYGHGPKKYSLPVGPRARLDAGRGLLHLLTSGVSHAQET